MIMGDGGGRRVGDSGCGETRASVKRERDPLQSRRGKRTRVRVRVRVRGRGMRSDFEFARRPR